MLLQQLLNQCSKLCMYGRKPYLVCISNHIGELCGIKGAKKNFLMESLLHTMNLHIMLIGSLAS